ncbi:MAG: hypothetical protein MJZ26_13090 [Fibrobacter sp.]|nr:hypothetical protein [Fibrobacter sp.]
MSRLIFFILIFLVTFANAAVTVSAPSTDADGCYAISSVEELYGFAAIVNGTDGMTKDTKACGKLTKDIVVNEGVVSSIDLSKLYTTVHSQWTPLRDFAGSFDGNGFSISGLYFYNTDFRSEGLSGFIESIGKASVLIKNLHIKDSFFGAYNSVARKIGGLVANAVYGSSLEISNCTVDALLYGGVDGTGGLVGYAAGTLTINESVFSGDINAHRTAGGLVGYSSTLLTISKSHNEGSVLLDGAIMMYAAGLVSIVNNATVVDSYNTGSIIGDSYTGGLIGSQSGSVNVSRCYNTGSIKGTNETGGLVGRAGGGTLSIQNSYNVGSIEGTDYLGGLVGRIVNKASLVNSYSFASIEGNLEMAGAIVSDVSNVYSMPYFVLDNCFYNSNVRSIYGGEEVAVSAFKTGYVANKLHSYHGDDIDGLLWGQKVGTDAYPVFRGEVNGAFKDVYHKLSFVTFDGDKTVYPTQFHDGVAIDIPKIEDESYVYAWYDNAEFTGSKYSYIPPTVGNDLTLYARLLKLAEPEKDAEDCYLISNEAALYSYAAIVNGTNGFKKNGSACAKLTEDITVNASVLDEGGLVRTADTAGFFPWVPIDSFAGTIDGQGHKISGLYYNDVNSSSGGLISGVHTGGKRAVIKNLGVEDSYIASQLRAGALVGYVSSYVLEISNCYSAANVHSAQYYAGGLVGGSWDSLKIMDSYNAGVVYGKIVGGGLVGEASDITVIEDSYNTGTIKGYDAGGLVGTSSGKTYVTGGYNVGSIEGTGVSAGLVAHVEDHVFISESYNRGHVGLNDVAVASSEYYAGGLVGRTGNDDTISVVNSYNVGDIDAGDKVAGGLVAYLYTRIQLTAVNSYNMGSITASDSKYQSGGILGRKSSQNEVIIDNCYYLEGVNGELGGITVTADEISDGTLFSNLHDYSKDEVFGSVWKQEMGKDPYPVLSGAKHKLEFKTGTSVLKTVMVFGGGILSSVALPEKRGYTYVPSTEIPDVMPDEDLEIQGEFVKNKYKVTVLVNDESMGSVSGLNETGIYDYLSAVWITAVPAEGYEFVSWDDNEYASEKRYVTINSDTTFVANFEKVSSSATSSSSEVSSNSAESSSSVEGTSSSSIISSAESSSSISSSGSSSSSVVSSSSVTVSSSSQKSPESSCSSANGDKGSSSSSKTEGFVVTGIPQFHVEVSGRSVLFAGAPLGMFAVFDMQGRVILQGIAETANFEIVLPHAGSYLVQLKGMTRQVHIQ